MALTPKGAKRADPAKDGERMVQIIHPVWFPREAGGQPAKREKGERFAVPEEMAAAWDAAGLSMVID